MDAAPCTVAEPSAAAASGGEDPAPPAVGEGSRITCPAYGDREDRPPGCRGRGIRRLPTFVRSLPSTRREGRMPKHPTPPDRAKRED
ncbi:hypothetical protein GCM10009776_02860 [Microbacterium deminutum]|uniref:Uncharacterized protein n=1 Tax=Microbacterium deminutum TaxID=344164 RepID=A0ABP5BJE3_9MICO